MRRTCLILAGLLPIALTAIAVIYPKQHLRSREFMLQNRLFALRAVIGEYTVDQKKPPQSLQDLVDAGYLNAVPVDPITGKDQWIVIQQDAPVHNDAPGIRDVHGASDGRSLDGTPYSRW